MPSYSGVGKPHRNTGPLTGFCFLQIVAKNKKIWYGLLVFSFVSTEMFWREPLVLVSAVGVILFSVLLWLVFDIRRKWGRVFGRGAPAEGKLLEELLHRIGKSEIRLDLVTPRIDALERIGTVSVQKVGFLRFNPFADTGGDQSFSLALLDHDNNGVVLSSLYIREGTRLYAKEIIKGEAKQPLSNEEKRVLGEAMQK